jgi:hypothetical protein
MVAAGREHSEARRRASMAEEAEEAEARGAETGTLGWAA